MDWAGSDVALQPPPPTPGSLEPAPPADAEAAVLEPLELGPLLYLVERTGPAESFITPIVEFAEDGYLPLPDPGETPDLLERFPLDRWETGSQFVLYSQNSPVGTFVSDGSTVATEDLCLTRSRGSGIVHLRPDASHESHFLALRRADLDDAPSFLEDYPGHRVTDELQDASVSVAQNLIAQIEIPWPASVPGIRRGLSVWLDGEGRRSLAGSFVFGDDLEVGPPQPRGYSLFLLGTETDQGFRPRFSWYQEADQGEKATPGFLAAHPLGVSGEPHLLLDVFGQENRWFALLEYAPEGSELVYRDPCGSDPLPGSFRTHS